MKTREMNVLVGMDLSKMDEALIRYLSVAHGLYPLARFIFLHNVKLSELPADFKTPEMLEKIQRQVAGRLREMIDESGFTHENVSIEVTLENFSEHAFLKVGKRVGANLVILGNKQNLSGSGGLPQKLIRMWEVASLLVPETFNPQPKKIIKAVDFSRYTPVINKVANHILEHNQFGITKADAVYVARVSWQFFPGPSDAELRTILQDQKIARKKRWKKEFPQEDELIVLPTANQSIASVLSEYMEQQRADLIIMGVLGASSLTGLFLGSVSNELISNPTNCCILLVKRQVSD